ncbi:MAG: hypothetical protein IT177_22500 [Acidobacteria bacterium]|nr:hypothetical protein [Acidobacteriota bacterium]
MQQRAPKATRTEQLARQCARLAPLLALPLTPGRRVSTAEACIRLGISRTTLWRKQRCGELPKAITTEVLAVHISKDGRG